METGWHTHAPSSWPGIWLDPKTNKLGEVSKYLQYNPDEAAKLLRAAGKFGMETDFSINSQSNNLVRRNLEVIAQMLQQGGHFKLNVQVLEYNTIFQPKYIFGHAQFEGIAGVPYGSWPDFDMLIWSLFSPKGRNDMVGPKPNQKIQDIMVKHRRELDDKKRTSLAHDWQRAMVEDMPAVPYPGEATSFNLTWPWLANATTYQGWTTHAASAETWVHWWYDKAKDTSG
jgi:ABC-type transport system substrate-binding protein